MAPAEDWAITPVRPIRVPGDLWNRFGEAAERAGGDRAKVLRDFMRWYIHEEGYKMPRRPPLSDSPQEP